MRDVQALHAAGVAHGDIHSGNIAERKIASGGFQFVLFDYGSAVVSPFSEHYTAFKAYTKNDVRRPHLEKALETLRNLKKERGSAFSPRPKRSRTLLSVAITGGARRKLTPKKSTCL